MYNSKLFSLFFTFLIMLQWGCKKDVTSDYLSDTASLVAVECLFSPQYPWEVFVSKTHKLNDKGDKEDLLNVSSIRIIEDGSRIINLSFDSKKKAFVSPEYPKAGHRYKLEVEIPDHPLITAEDYVPSKVDISDCKVDFDKQPFVEDINSGSDLYYKTTFNIKQAASNAQYFRLNVSVLESYPSYFKMLPTTIAGLRNRNVPEEIIQQLINDTQDGQLPYYNFSGLFSDNVLEQILPAETKAQWKTKYGNLINPFILSIKDFFPLVLENPSFKPSNIEVKGRDVIFSKNKYFDRMLMGNLKYYNGQQIEIYIDPNDDHLGMKMFVSKDPDETFGHSGTEFYTTQLEFISLSNSLNRYMRDVTIQNNSNGDIFAPTIMVQSNIKNGVGIFGGSNKSVTPLYYVRNEYKF